ncbi:hypothetical protein M8998_11905 [Sphingobacterium sp. lm-10]|uniref:tyrosine-protein phosphatase n=1 Tax=Sphingobacterium sp. lm-10 TaxID=2944904 RepID=UPI0020227FA2|nr:CpsB/CapC family capsule biosynthesis tyrosine phosphatase [Sphingobacterium sp. lm-10]MCL7988642.1 hypothetical protein [Sphingobacterium sp. lm-10]
MLNIFRGKRQFQNLDWMQIDMHSHILPGLDDGASTLADGLQLMERLNALGIQKFFFTPHIFQGMYPNTTQGIANAYELVLGSNYTEMAAGFAAEYMVDTFFDSLLQSGEKLATLPNNQILIEMSYIQESSLIEKVIFDLQMQGYKPILAHPERYVFYHGNIKAIQRLRELGCLLQLNLLSLYGYYGPNEKKTARLLSEKGLVDLVGTDIHHMRHVKALEHWIRKEDLWPYFKRCNLQNQALYDIAYA